jgi:hypothetical protein
MVVLVAGLRPLTGEPAIAEPYPLRVSEDGVARLHDAVRLCAGVDDRAVGKVPISALFENTA